MAAKQHPGPATPGAPADGDGRRLDPPPRQGDVLASALAELRGPVDAIRGDVRRALAGIHGPVADELREVLESIDERATRLAALQRDLRELHDLATGAVQLRRTAVDLTELWGQVASALAPLAAARGVALERELPTFPVSVLADARLLRPALEELAARAVESAPEGARLALRLDALPGGGRLALELRGATGAVASALPVPPPLSVVRARAVVDAHGGALDLSAGRLELWLVQDAGASPAAGAPGPAARPRILVVEDDGPTLEALTEALSDTYDVEPAVDGIEGVEAARARRPDLVLMDLFLPRLDGFAALEALRADPSTAEVPVILVSGAGDDLTRARSLDLGAVDFLQKPYSERELRARIERTLRLERRQSELQALAETDALTGLANRRAFRSRLEQEVKRARRYGTPLACVMVDMDHLKPLNDVHGHAAGDRALAAIAAVLRTELRETDLCARWGGDEFVALLPHTTAAEGRALAERICDRLRATPFEAGGASLRLQASFGVAELGGGAPEDAAEALLRNADAALYDAKGSGRGRVAVWAAEDPAAPHAG